MYVVRGIKKKGDKYGRAYNYVWGNYETLEEAMKHAEMSTQTSYADTVTVEKYELATTLFVGTGIPVEQRRSPRTTGTVTEVKK